MRRVPFVAQLTANDCAVAALAMVLACHGLRVRRSTVRAALREPGRDGASAFGVVQAAARFGLRARGLRVPLGRVPELAKGTLLHWERRHFVVLEGAARGGVWIVDPACGRRRVSTAELEASFAGLALVFTREGGRDDAREGSPAWTLVRATRVLGPACISVLLGLAGVAAAISLPSTAALVAITAAYVTLAFLRRALLERAGREVERRLAAAMLDALLLAPRSFHRDRAREDILQRLTSAASLRTALEESFGAIVTDGVVVVVALCATAIVSPPLCVAVAVLAASQSLLGWVARAADERNASPLAEAELRAHERRILDAPETADANELRRRWTTLHLAAARRPRAIIAAGDACAVVLPIVLLAVAMRVAPQADEAFVACALGLACLRSLAGLLATLGRAVGMRRAIERIDDVLEAALAPGERRPLLPLRLEEASVHYNPDASPALDRVTMTIEPGTTLLVIGDGGAGKSTLCGLVAGDIEPTSGTLRDHQGLPAAPEDLRRAVLRLDATPSLVEGSIRENVTSGVAGIDHARVVEAARLVGAHDTIADMPLGYDTPVGAGGGSLPGGLRQLLCLTRALLHDPELIVVDGALAVLDQDAEARALAGLRSKGCALIVASSRFVAGADRVLSMRAGRVVERLRAESRRSASG